MPSSSMKYGGPWTTNMIRRIQEPAWIEHPPTDRLQGRRQACFRRLGATHTSAVRSQELEFPRGHSAEDVRAIRRIESDRSDHGPRVPSREDETAPIFDPEPAGVRPRHARALAGRP